MIRVLRAFLLAASPVFNHAIEEPGCEVISQVEAVELRQYATYVAAEVPLNSSAEAAGNQAFPILAGDISPQ
jgi:trehalose-6-phosphatase